LEDYSKDKVKLNDRQIIQAENCQYYIDFPVPDTAYKKETGNSISGLDLLLPSDWSIASPASGDTQLSSWYRGKRYSFAQ
jgi:hypothetical protein